MLRFLNFRAKNFGGKITTNNFPQELLFRNGFITCSAKIYDFLKNCNVNFSKSNLSVTWLYEHELWILAPKISKFSLVTILKIFSHVTVVRFDYINGD